jgi:hypothetical protein
MQLPRRLLAVCLALSLLLSAVPAPVAGERVAGEPNLSVFAPENELVPGETTTLQLFVRNAGDLTDAGDPGYEALVQTARATTLRLKSGQAPVTVRTGRTPVGSLPDGVHGPVPFRVTVAEDAEPGTYRLPVAVAYEYTSRVSAIETGDPILTQRRVSTTQHVTVEVTDDARFRVVGVTTDAAVGESGTVDVTLRNVGTATATESTVSLTAADPELRVGAGTTAESFVGTWAPGENRTVTYRVGVAPDAVVRNYSLRALVTYRNDDGTRQTADPLPVGVTPAPAQSFAVEDVSSTARVDGDGEVAGVVRNTGERAAEDVRVTVAAPPAGLVFQTVTYPVGDLGPGESAPFNFSVVASNATAPGPRAVSFAVSARDDTGTQVVAEESTTRVEVGPRRATLDLQPLDATLAVGGDGVLSVSVTNRGETPVSQVTARLVPTDPLESDDPVAYVDRLGPDETATLRFDLSVDGAAVPKTAPVPVSLTYRTSGGAARATEATVPLEVVPREGSDLPVLPLVGVVAVLAAAGVWWWRRR